MLVNIFPVNIYRRIFHVSVLRSLAPQTAVEVYNSTGVNVRGFWNMYAHETKPLQALTFSVTNTEGSLLLSCVDNLVLSLVTPGSYFED